MSKKTVVAQWSMSPSPGYEGTATFYSDGSAEFFEEPTRHSEYDRGNRTRKILFSVFSEDDRHLSDEVCRYTFTFWIPTTLLNKIVAASDQINVSEEGDCISDISPEEESEIDLALNKVFWKDINPKLWRPLDEPSCYRSSWRPFNRKMKMREWIEVSIQPKKPWLSPPWCFTSEDLKNEQRQSIAATHSEAGLSASEAVLLYVDSQVPGDRAAGVAVTDKAIYWKSPLGENGCWPLDRLGLVTLKPNDTSFQLHVGSGGKSPSSAARVDLASVGRAT